MVAVMGGIGFSAVTVEHEHLCLEQDLSTWVETVRRRDTCSQLLAIPDEAYEAQLAADEIKAQVQKRERRGTRKVSRSMLALA